MFLKRDFGSLQKKTLFSILFGSLFALEHFMPKVADFSDCRGIHISAFLGAEIPNAIGIGNLACITRVGKMLKKFICIFVDKILRLMVTDVLASLKVVI